MMTENKILDEVIYFKRGKVRDQGALQLALA
jgi:hypothetical protein